MASKLRLWRPSTLLLLGAGLLAADPLRWLLGSWTDAAYNPQGGWIALLVFGLAAWSCTSRLLPDAPASRRYAYGLLMASAGVRAIGQLLRVNVIGAATLALDVYALSTLAGLKHRERPLSPLWLAVLFALSLPVERVVQRLLGFALQEISSAGACGLLRLASDAQCLGNRILIAGQELMVDLPCSGTRGLMLVLALFATLAALRRPSRRQALTGLALAVCGALAGNILRIAALALGLAHPGAVDVMATPWHDAIGLVALAVSAAPLLWWVQRITGACRSAFRPKLLREPQPAWRAATAFAASALMIVLLPARPLDVARDTPAPQIPQTVDVWTAQPQPLTAQERAYFTQFGGGAARARYGDFALLMVSTAAPLRHLHAPDECLRGAGHRVRYLGVAVGALPSALYRTTDPDGHEWRVAVSYVSSRGDFTPSIAQAVWLWLKNPGGRWTMIQRVTPWSAPDADVARFETAVLRSLDLPSAPPRSLHLLPAA